MTPQQAIEDRFPKLAADGYRITSPPDDRYNCVAWVARDTRRWWEPGIDGCWWPSNLGDGDALADYIGAFESLGFEACAEGSLEVGYEKIAVYATEQDFEHVAFQRADGTWSSKLGKLADIRHEQTESLAGTGVFEYPGVRLYLRRAREQHDLAETGLLLPQ